MKNSDPKSTSGSHTGGSNHSVASNGGPGGSTANKMPGSKSGCHGSGSNHKTAESTRN